MSQKSRFRNVTVKYAFGNKPDERKIEWQLKKMADDGYRLVSRTEKSPGCLGAISSSIFGGGSTALMFELRDE